MRVRYTITMEREINLEDWNVKTNEECLKVLRKYLDDDISYAVDGIFDNPGDKIEVEIVKDAPQ